MSEKKSIVVIGSINMDLVCRAARFPAVGETVMGKDFQMIPGGKVRINPSPRPGLLEA